MVKQSCERPRRLMEAHEDRVDTRTHGPHLPLVPPVRKRPGGFTIQAGNRTLSGCKWYHEGFGRCLRLLCTCRSTDRPRHSNINATDPGKIPKLEQNSLHAHLFSGLSSSWTLRCPTIPLSTGHGRIHRPIVANFPHCITQPVLMVIEGTQRPR